MLSSHTFPRKFSMSFDRFSDISSEHLQQLSVEIKHSMNHQKFVSVKPVINETCANIFTQYFTTRSFDKSDKKFQQLIKNFDKIFWEVNQGYAADFLPFLLPFHRNNMKKMEQWSHEIRKFILENIIGDRYETWTVGSEPNDYIESLIDHVKQEMQPKMEWETVRKTNKPQNIKLLINLSIFLPSGVVCVGRHSRWLLSCFQFCGEGSRLCRETQRCSEKYSIGS